MEVFNGMPIWMVQMYQPRRWLGRDQDANIDENCLMRELCPSGADVDKSGPFGLGVLDRFGTITDMSEPSSTPFNRQTNKAMINKTIIKTVFG